MKNGQPAGCPFKITLLFHDFQDVHGTSLGADTAGDTLGSSAAFLHDHNLHGAGFHTLATRNAQLLVDHVNAGLGVLGDGLVLTDLHALAALDADHGLGSAVLLNDVDAAQGNVIDLIESLGTGLGTLQASHAFCAFYNSELLHKRTLLYKLFIYSYHYTYVSIKKQRKKLIFSNFYC